MLGTATAVGRDSPRRTGAKGRWTRPTDPRGRVGGSDGPGGFSLVWAEGHPGPVVALLPGSDKPGRLAERGRDPVVAAPVRGKGPVVTAWEEGEPEARRIRAVVLSPAR
jgi:hypothetical protein